jgi:hypothetical protein
MSDRDELFQLILGRTTTKAVERILAAGYRKPRTVTTVEELDALPVGSVIRTGGYGGQYAPRIAEKNGKTEDLSYWQVAGPDDIDVTSDELDDLPATVLYAPEPQT